MSNNDQPPEAPWESRLSAPLYRLAVCLQFLTRLPLPKDLNPSAKSFAESAYWFPIVGVILGSMSTAVAYLAFALTDAPALTAVFALIFLAWATGMLHEDGLADTADALWGGSTPQRRLEIMRDSRIGTYGSCALVLLYSLRITSLSVLPLEDWWLALCSALALGRLSSLSLIPALPYARATQTGLAKPLIEGLCPQRCTRLIMFCLGLTIALCAFAREGGFWLGLGLVICFGLIVHQGKHLAQTHLGGITGDLLGAINVTVEVTCLVVWVVLGRSAAYT